MLTKQGIDISFAQGLDTKTDPKRVQVGKFLELQNTVFDKGGLLQKRNGYGSLTALPDTSYSYLTTFNGNLTAIGSNIAAYNAGGMSWVTRGQLQPLSLATLPVIRNNLNQTNCDIAIAPNGIGCCVYLESNGAATSHKYVIFDSVTGQNIKAPSAVPVGSGTVTGGMRVFVLGSHFIMVFTNVITATSHLQYVSVSIADPTIVGTNTDISSAYIATTTLSWDGYVVGSRLYVAYNVTAGGQAVKITYLTSNFVLAAAVSFAAAKANIMSVTADVTNAGSPVIYAAYFNSTDNSGHTIAVDQNLNTISGPNTVFTGSAATNFIAAAQNGTCTVFWENPASYSYDSGIPSYVIVSRSITGTSLSSQTVPIQSVGLASKTFIVDGVIYFLAVYQSPYQSTYFLINGSQSLDSAPVIAGKLAYSNAGGYLTTGLPSINLTGAVARVGYLFKDLIQAVNKNTATPAGTQTVGIYSQTGINLATFSLGTSGLDAAEIGSDLHLTGGFLWMYDGYLPVEHNFFLWPDSVEATWSATGGSIVAKPDGTTSTAAYWYQVTYEWTDNQGNAFRSAPSIPISVTTTGSGTAGSISVSVPTLRLTMKTANPVKIVIYRWSVAQQNYYQVTSITAPTLNNTTTDSITYVDTSADATILGNNLIYTTGGVVEDVNAPATDAVTIFDTRLWLINAEDPNSLWFSKQVIEATPVEMSDLFTKFVPPTTGTGQSTGPCRTLAPLDDKLIIGKDNALLYINGSGPDNTGANNQYSEAVFITSTVGCTNQKSIVLMPRGLMFQSNKGIWLLDRGLQTSYIGAPVQDFTTGATVLSAVNVPETNQVRFTLDTGVTLMYDYYYDQWGTFVNVPCLSSCIYQDLHTFINAQGKAFQESPGTYLDGSLPVLLRFKTGPLRVGALQGYQRAYYFYLLGTFLSPHKLYVSMSYDYETSPSQSVLITPNNYSTPYGSGLSQSPYGQGSPYGGPSNTENWRIFLDRQRCSAIGITVQEIFDSSVGVAAGAGLTLSGINMVIAVKKGWRPQASAESVG